MDRRRRREIAFDRYTFRRDARVRRSFARRAFFRRRVGPLSRTKKEEAHCNTSFVLGDRDKNGAWLITFPGHPGGRRTGDLTFDDVKKLARYLKRRRGPRARLPTTPPLFLLSKIRDPRSRLSSTRETRRGSFAKFVVRGLQVRKTRKRKGRGEE